MLTWIVGYIIVAAVFLGGLSVFMRINKRDDV